MPDSKRSVIGVIIHAAAVILLLPFSMFWLLGGRTEHYNRLPIVRRQKFTADTVYRCLRYK